MLVAAWMLASTSIALVAIGVLLQIATRHEDVGRYFFSFRGSTAAAVVAFAVLGLVLAVRTRRNPIGWLFLGGALLGGIQNVTIEYAVWGLFAQSPHAPGASIAAWFNEWIWVPLVYGVAVYSVLLFPDGRLPSARWSLVVWLVSAELVLATFAFMTEPGPMQSGLGAENPFGLESGSVLSQLRMVGMALFPVPFVAAAAAPISRARRAGALERAQIRWLGLSAALLAAVFLVGGPLLLFNPEAFLAKFVGNLTLVALIGVPTSIAIAILKYRLYDIDLVINRTLVYGVLTAVLVGTYGVGVLFFRTILRPVTGDSDIAIAASTLAVAAVFGPARRRIQAFIDRRFYRSRYDAQQTLEAFGARLRDEVELEAVSAEVLGVVERTLHPEFAGVWLADRNDSGTMAE